MDLNSIQFLVLGLLIVAQLVSWARVSILTNDLRDRIDHIQNTPAAEKLLAEYKKYVPDTQFEWRNNQFRCRRYGFYYRTFDSFQKLIDSAIAEHHRKKCTPVVPTRVEDDGYGSQGIGDEPKLIPGHIVYAGSSGPANRILTSQEFAHEPAANPLDKGEMLYATESGRFQGADKGIQELARGHVVLSGCGKRFQEAFVMAHDPKPSRKSTKRRKKNA